MKMKKVLIAVLAVVLAISCIACFAACNKKGSEENATTEELPELEGMEKPDYSGLTFGSDFKVGLITLHDTNSTYDKNFIDAFKSATAELGLSQNQVIIKTGIDESAACLTAANDLVDQGCDVIFADSFGHETYMIQAAQQHPNVQFCHATGTKAHTSGLANYHNAFASIYEGRYLAGVAAGMKIKEMIDNGETVNGIKVTAANAKMGYVGAWPYAEVKSGYTSFYLGAKSIVPTVTMEVKFTNSWYDEVAEKETANYLMNNGCILISQHADSMGAPTACEAKGVPNVSYNGSTINACPSTFIVSSRIDWAPYYKLAIAATVKGTTIPADYTGTLKSGSVVLTAINLEAAAKDTVKKLTEVRAAIVKGDVKVFDTNTFTVGGNKLTTYLADVDDFGDFVGETEVVANGAFQESKFRSAPYFDIDIDGITIK